MSVLALALTGCAAGSDPLPQVADLATPCGFLGDSDRETLRLAPGTLSTAPAMGTGEPATLCVFRATEPGSDDHVDSVSVTFLPTTLDVARTALDNVERTGRMSRFAAGTGGVLERSGTRLGEPTCERLFAARADRAVQVGLTVERLPVNEPVCHAASRLAPLIDERIPRD
jgi:hypothetical protein